MEDDEPKQRNWKRLAPMLREHLVQDEIPCTILVDGLPRLHEDGIRRDLMKLLISEFKTAPVLLAPIPYFTKQDVWRVVFKTADDADTVAEKTAMFRGNVPISFVRPPAKTDSKPTGRRKRKSMDDAPAATPAKMAKHDEDTLTPTKRGAQAHAEVEENSISSEKQEEKPAKKVKQEPKRRASIQTEPERRASICTTNNNEPDEFAVDKIIRSRDVVGGRKEYLLDISGGGDETSQRRIRLWFFDPELVSTIASGKEATASTVQSDVSTTEQPTSSSKSQVDSIPSAAELEKRTPAQSDIPEIEEVVGAKVIDYQLCLYVKWAGSGLASFLPATTVSKIAPQKVIKFYESNLQFCDTSSQDGRKN